MGEQTRKRLKGPRTHQEGTSGRDRKQAWESLLIFFSTVAYLSFVYWISFLIRPASSYFFSPPAIWKREANILSIAKLTDADELNAWRQQCFSEWISHLWVGLGEPVAAGALERRAFNTYGKCQVFQRRLFLYRSHIWSVLLRCLIICLELWNHMYEWRDQMQLRNLW